MDINPAVDHKARRYMQIAALERKLTLQQVAIRNAKAHVKDLQRESESHPVGAARRGPEGDLPLLDMMDDPSQQESVVEMAAPVNLAMYREESERLKRQLAEVDSQRARVLRAIRANETLIATAIAPEQPLLPIEGLERRGRRSTTRHGRALGATLNARDRRVLRQIDKGPISFGDLQERTGVNEWTLRDSIARLLVAGEVKRFGLARATRFAKASLKTEPDSSFLGFLVSK